MASAIAPVCIESTTANRSACSTPLEIAYVSRCEQVACAGCLERSVLQMRLGLAGRCYGCDTRVTSAEDVLRHWRRIAPAPMPGQRKDAAP